MFAFENWHSALEMKLYLHRFLHHIGGLPDLSALKFTRFNQHESLILPLVEYLKKEGVQFEHGIKVTNVLFHFLPGKGGPPAGICPERPAPQPGAGRKRSGVRDQRLLHRGRGPWLQRRSTPPDVENGQGSSWELWKNLAVQNPAFGNPGAFCSDIQATKWESATVTLLDDRIAPMCRRSATGIPIPGGW